MSDRAPLRRYHSKLVITTEGGQLRCKFAGQRNLSNALRWIWSDARLRRPESKQSNQNRMETRTRPRSSVTNVPQGTVVNNAALGNSDIFRKIRFAIGGCRPRPNTTRSNPPPLMCFPKDGKRIPIKGRWRIAHRARQTSSPAGSDARPRLAVFLDPATNKNKPSVKNKSSTAATNKRQTSVIATNAIPSRKNLPSSRALQRFGEPPRLRRNRGFEFPGEIAAPSPRAWNRPDVCSKVYFQRSASFSPTSAAGTPNASLVRKNRPKPSALHADTQAAHRQRVLGIGRGRTKLNGIESGLTWA